MNMDWVIEANSISADLLRPDLNIYIDISPEVSMNRITKGRSQTELYETLDNLKNVREKYLEAFERLQSSEHIFMTAGNRNSEAIAVDIWQKVNSLAGTY